MSFNDCLILFFCPSILFDLRIQMVVPSENLFKKNLDNLFLFLFLPFPALFPYPPWEMFCDWAPILGTLFEHQFCNDFIFFFCPGPFYQGRIENFLPTMETLNIRTLFEITSNLLPVLCPVLFYQLFKEFIFFFSPPALCSIRRRISSFILRPYSFII